MSEKSPPTAGDETLNRSVAAAQEQLDYLRDQLTESQRLATIGTITAVIAHEFNNLLTPVVSYSQYALASAESAEPDMALIRKALSKAFQGSSKAGKICASMLALPRAKRAALPYLAPGRVDVIGAGALVWDEVLSRVDARSPGVRVERMCGPGTITGRVAGSKGASNAPPGRTWKLPPCPDGLGIA